MLISFNFYYYLLVQVPTRTGIAPDYREQFMQLYQQGQEEGHKLSTTQQTGVSYMLFGYYTFCM